MRQLQAFLSRGRSRPPLQRAALPSSAHWQRWRATRQPSRDANRSQRRQGSTWAPATAAVHADAGIDKTSHDSDVAPPIGLSTTFDDGADHVYSRISAPTRQRCEAVLAALEGGEGARAVLFASGNAATHAVLASLAARARENGRTPRVATEGIGYHGTRDAVAALGPAVEVVGGADLGEGDVVWLESPRNPDLRVPDVAEACAGPADVVVDATFAPLAQRLLDEDVACVVHSATKGLGGHSDLLGGVAITRCADLADRLAWHRTAAGAAPGSLDCWLLLRSLRTLDVRVTRQSSSAQRVAEALEASGLLQRVLYPGLASHPDHAVAKRQMTSYGSILAVECRSEAAARALPDELALFRSATSLGGVESLAEWRRKYDDAVSPLLVRLSIGLEDPDDLIGDLLGALRRLEYHRARCEGVGVEY